MYQPMTGVPLTVQEEHAGPTTCETTDGVLTRGTSPPSITESGTSEPDVAGRIVTATSQMP